MTKRVFASGWTLLVSLVLVGSLLLTAVLPVLAQGGSATTTQPTAAGMFAALNEWRLSQGLAPFKYNPTLEALAMLQLQYILSKPDIPKNIHDGILGEGVRDRGLWEPFSWPYYDVPERIDLVEITVAQRTIRQGITWWKNSPIHNEAATNPYYREAGVAALPYKYGTVFVAVLGGRPDVLPALVHPDGETLYLTQEHFWTQSPTSIGFVRRVRLLDSDRTPLGDWQPWQATLDMPEVSGTILYVEYSDGNRIVTTEVNLNTDVISLPGYPAPGASTLPVAATEITPPESALITLLEASADQFVVQATVSEPVYLADFHIFSLVREQNPVDKTFSQAFPGQNYAAPDSCFVLRIEGSRAALPEGCSGPVLTFPVLEKDAFWYDPAREDRAMMFILSQRGRLLADCQEAAADCVFSVAASTTAAGEAEQEVTRTIELIYSPLSFTLVNRGGQPLNLLGLTFANETGRLPIGVWNIATSSAPLGFFPADDCLQTWGFNDPKQPKPGSCGVRHAWVTVTDSQKVWLEGTFDVIYNGATLATCEASANQCVFELPG